MPPKPEATGAGARPRTVASMFPASRCFCLPEQDGARHLRPRSCTQLRLAQDSVGDAGRVDRREAASGMDVAWLTRFGAAVFIFPMQVATAAGMATVWLAAEGSNVSRP